MLITQRIEEAIKNGDVDYDKHYNYLVGYLRDINYKWADELDRIHSTTAKRKELIEETIANKGPYIQLMPFTDGVDENLVIKLKEKYKIDKSPVTFGLPDKDGNVRWVTTRRPVCIAPNYWFCLYIIPHIRSCGLGYVSQYYSPVRSSALAKLQSPISQTPIRMGEDEIRNISMVSGSENAARILCMYGNSKVAVNKLAEHMLFSKSPSKLDHIDMSTADMISTNSIIGVLKHVLAVTGVKMTSIHGDEPNAVDPKPNN